MQKEAPPEQDNVHYLSAARTREGIREEPLSRRLQSRGTRHEGQPTGSQSSGKDHIRLGMCDLLDYVWVGW